jgi:hypothetical protein
LDASEDTGLSRDASLGSRRWAVGTREGGGRRAGRPHPDEGLLEGGRLRTWVAGLPPAGAASQGLGGRGGVAGAGREGRRHRRARVGRRGRRACEGGRRVCEGGRRDKLGAGGFFLPTSKEG